jgi:hypothetical protein
MLHRLFVVGFSLVLLAGCTLTDVASPPEIRTAVETYPTQEECEQVTGKTCSFAMCDYIPDGQTYEEACGRGFKKGWTPMNNPE